MNRLSMIILGLFFLGCTSSTGSHSPGSGDKGDPIIINSDDTSDDSSGDDDSTGDDTDGADDDDGSEFTFSGLDTDGDGYLDDYEIAEGTDPEDPDEYPASEYGGATYIYKKISDFMTITDDISDKLVRYDVTGDMELCVHPKKQGTFGDASQISYMVGDPYNNVLTESQNENYITFTKEDEYERLEDGILEVGNMILLNGYMLFSSSWGGCLRMYGITVSSKVDGSIVCSNESDKAGQIVSVSDYVGTISLYAATPYSDDTYTFSFEKEVPECYN